MTLTLAIAQFPSTVIDNFGPIRARYNYNFSITLVIYQKNFLVSKISSRQNSDLKS